MKWWLDWRSKVVDLGVSGIVQELNTGTLVLSSVSGNTVSIKRSTDNGATWSTRQTMTMVAAASPGMKGSFVDSRGHVYLGGQVQNCTYESIAAARGWFAELWKSSDDGLTWRKCFTGASSSVWKLTEDSQHRVYCNEYSLVPNNGETEYPAVNIWRSDTTGENWTVWATLPKETSAGVKDGVRHIHGVYVDAVDRIFAACGDANWGGLAGSTLRLDAAGAVDLDYGRPPNTNGNGLVALIANQAGMILGGGDSTPSGIYAMTPTAALSCKVCDFRTEAGGRFDGYVFDLLRSSDNVLYANLTPPSGNATIRSSVAVSYDEGVNWGGLDLGSGVHPNSITHNPLGTSGALFCSGAVKRVLLPTVAQLSAKRPYYVPEA